MENVDFIALIREVLSYSRIGLIFAFKSYSFYAKSYLPFISREIRQLWRLVLQKTETMTTPTHLVGIHKRI